MDGEKAYQEAVEKIASKIDSWEDLYHFFDKLMERVRTTQSMLAIMDAMFSMYGFIVAMKDNPEEGDARKLCESMLRNILVDGKEKIGFELTLASSEELESMVASRLHELLGAAAAMQMPEIAPAEPEPVKGSKGKRTLH